MRLTSPAISTSRASSRARKAAISSPAGCAVGMSFMLCTAMSMRRASIASSISLTNRPLPPASLSGRSWMASPVVLMTTISIASGAASAGTDRGQRIAHQSGLGEGELAAARAESQGCHAAALA